jgi:hypothetical protein
MAMTTRAMWITFEKPFLGLDLLSSLPPSGPFGSFVADFKGVMNDCAIPVILLTEMDYPIYAKCTILCPKAFS